MTKLSRSLFVTLVFLIGCATGGAASQVAAPPAFAQTASEQRWSYTCLKEDSADSIQERANEIGGQGWELAAVSLQGGGPVASPIWCFKQKYRQASAQ